MAPLGRILGTGVRTARAFGQRVPGAGSVLAPSLTSAVEGRLVLITGASSGIGAAAAERIGAAGARVVLVARTQEKLEEVAEAVRSGAAQAGSGGEAHVFPCDLNDSDDIDRMAAELQAELGVPDVLVNNAGRSIRRSVRRSYDRFHDYQRTMQLNYFGAVKLILDVLPGMRERGSGHIINVSTMGLQTNTPRYSAYLASKAALDAFSRSIGPEIIDDGVHITTIYMPLVRTPMIAPTKLYDRFPALSPEDAGGLIAEAIQRRPKRITTTLGTLGQLGYAVAPGAQDLVVNRAVKLFTDSGSPSDREAEGRRTRAEREAFVRATRGVHW
jgi:NAD(P)-dependent dehydrogenase (short-subunit alcohol dehydrogenase family)